MMPRAICATGGPADADPIQPAHRLRAAQYAQYTVVDNIHINSKLTSGEDVADLGGTLLAYIAWKKETQGQDLKPIDGFTPDQRFFIGYGQWACENERPENLRLHATIDEHSPVSTASTPSFPTCRSSSRRSAVSRASPWFGRRCAGCGKDEACS